MNLRQKLSWSGETVASQFHEYAVNEMDPGQARWSTGRRTGKRWDCWGERSWKSLLWGQETGDGQRRGREIAVKWLEWEGRAYGVIGICWYQAEGDGKGQPLARHRRVLVLG